MNREIERFETLRGGRVYRLPLEVFPGFNAYSHLVFGDGLRALVDVGSGFGDSNSDLERGLERVRTEHGEPADWSDLTHVLISHGHIDHFGGLRFVRPRCRAQVGVHDLDYRVLTRYEERLGVVASRLGAYLIEAGVERSRREALMRLYLVNKELFASVQVDFTYEVAQNQIGPLQVIHVPGHCPGQVVLRFEDLLLTGDHVLKGTSPHQAPERLTLNTGLGHYLESIRKLTPLASQVRLALGGHEGPIEDLSARLVSIEKLHLERLQAILAGLDEPKTIDQIAQALFPRAEGYHELLALEEAGAHVEYLEQRSFVSIANAGELEAEGRVPIRFGRGPRSIGELRTAFHGLPDSGGASTTEDDDVRI